MLYKKIVLNNGLTVITADMPGMESVSIGVWIGAGGRYEDKEKIGISHFLEHMVFKGTKKRSAKELKESIEGKGGALNGFTGEEFTCYLAKVLAKDAPLAIDVLCDMALNPKIALKDFQKERLVILEEIKMYIDMPNHYVHELLAQLLWPDQPLGMPLAGTPQTVSALNQKDLVIYRDNLYNPKNIVVSLSGKLAVDDFVKRVEENFSGGRVKSKPRFTPVKISQKAPMANFYFKETEQTHIAMGIHGYSRFSEDKYILDILNIVLGGNMSSRLFQEVREKSGLAYEISSSVKHYQDTGALVISAGIDNKKVSEAIKVIVKVLNKLKKEGPKAEEFQRAREFYRGQLLMIFEETMGHMLWLGEKFISGDMEFKAGDIIKRLDKVTIGDVRRVAQDILRPRNINIASVGPSKKEIEAEVKKRICEV